MRTAHDLVVDCVEGFGEAVAAVEVVALVAGEVVERDGEGAAGGAAVAGDAHELGCFDAKGGHRVLSAVFLVDVEYERWVFGGSFLEFSGELIRKNMAERYTGCCSQ
jgi:hypothetical protein